MSFDKLINLGINCATTEAMQQLEIFSGNSPFDWCVSTPDCTNLFILNLYLQGLEDTCDKYFDFDTNRNEFGDSNVFGMRIPHLKEYGKDKAKTRIEKFLKNLLDTESKILFTVLGMFDNRQINVCNYEDDILRMKSLISLFRPENSFEICVCYCGYFSFGSLDKLRKENGFSIIEISRVPEEKYWVFPLLSHVSDKYNLSRGSRKGVFF